MLKHLVELKDLPTPGRHNVAVLISNHEEYQMVLTQLDMMGWKWVGSGLGALKGKIPYYDSMVVYLGQDSSMLTWGFQDSCENEMTWYLSSNEGEVKEKITCLNRCPQCGSTSVSWAALALKCNDCWNVW